MGRLHPFHPTILLFLALISTTPALAQECVHYEDMLHFVGMIPEDEIYYMYDVEVHDEYAYILSNGDGMLVVDIQDRANPVALEIWDDASYLLHALWHEGLLLVVDEYDGLYILDPSDPTDLTTLSNVPVLGYELNNVAAQNNLVVLAEDGLLRVIDISVPSAPVLRGTLDMSDDPEGMCFDPLDDTLLYVAVIGGGVIVVDLGNPDDPMLVGAESWADASAYDVECSDGYLYIADYDNGLVVCQANGATDPSFLGMHAFGNGYGYPLEVEVGNGYAFLSGDYAGGVAFDITNPANPTETALFGLDSYVYNIDLCGDYLYLTVEGYGVFIFDVSNPVYQTPAEGLGVGLDGVAFAEDLPRLYLADSAGDLHCIHMETQSVVGSLAGSGQVKGLAHREGVVYLANPNQGLLMVDVSDPANPFQADIWPVDVNPVNSSPRAIAIQDRDLYLLLDDHGIRQFFIDDPYYPDPLGLAGTLTSYSHMAIYGHYAYAIGWVGDLEVFDISSAESPVSLGLVPGAEDAQAMLADDRALYILSDEEGLVVFDLSNPAAPVRVSQVWYPTAYYGSSLATEGDFLYVGTSSGNDYEDSSIWVFDVSQLDDPRCVGAMGEPFDAHAIMQIGTRIWSTHPDEGLVQYPLQCDLLVTAVEAPSAGSLVLRNFPNPFNPNTLIEYRLTEDSFVELEVFDVSGRRVKTLVSNTQLAGPHACEWDGRNEEGRSMASGIYLARVQAGNLVGESKLILMK